jgi:hypothetical protein
MADRVDHVVAIREQARAEPLGEHGEPVTRPELVPGGDHAFARLLFTARAQFVAQHVGE